ncbi:hypothetical protein WMW72_29105 [Paenibacillus filicis]|uniref:Copper resistance protein D domain-containing protein n=1 Tax=Paenibacillus filicis TaxID=669464 RepID=A0ABU9DSY0_9BACL
MFGLMLFLHFAGLAAWFGALLAAAVTLSVGGKQAGSPELRAAGVRLIRVFQGIGHTGAVALLVSGVVMIISMDLGKNKPLWLEVMEKGGGTVILLALVVLGMMGSRLMKRLAEGRQSGVRPSRYVAAVSVFLVLIASVMLVVSIKI